MKPAAIVLLTSVLLTSALCAQAGQSPVNADAAVVQDFQQRVAAYLKLRKSIESDIGRLKPTKSPEVISDYESELRHAIRRARQNARPGDIFTPEIATEIRRLISIAMRPDGPQIRRSLRSGEPIQLHLTINEKYPESVPLQTTPQSLLENLPALPPEIEYRITGQDLVLLDAKANLIVDVMRGVFS